MKNNKFYTLKLNHSQKRIMIKCIGISEYRYKIKIIETGKEEYVNKLVDFQEPWIESEKIKRINSILEKYSYMIFPTTMVRESLKNRYLWEISFFGYVLINQKEKGNYENMYMKVLDEYRKNNKINGEEIDREEKKIEFNSFYSFNELFEKLEKKGVKLTEEEVEMMLLT
uniref:hypothetical protein n=1 Tax=Ornithobacterium rhinotracheale TaxID=28251 RepID=UPI0039A5F184